ncbi:hypothetical protein [Pseudodesulfovibrio karagichevae]|uniref:CARDB domain-containing protein n=1 Tax=Pseudodesulfovibrio karagichevae TaxID=3239305 RepID=A0ABV4K9J5_9BACT
MRKTNFFDSEIGRILLKWLERLLLPKFHNKLAYAIVFLGAGMLVVSPNGELVTAAVISVAEKFFGQLDYLRNFHSNQQISPLWGTMVIGIGACYHIASCALGIWKDKNQYHTIPERPKPSIESFLVLPDGNLLPDEYQIEGCTITVENKDDIRDYTVSAGPLGIGFQDFLNHSYNISYYREQAEYLENWAGACIFRVRINNLGQSAVSSVRVEIHFDPDHPVAFQISRSLEPFPSEKRDIYNISSLNFHSDIAKELKIIRNNNISFIVWDIGDMQPSRQLETEMFISVRCYEDVTCHVRIYCNEFSQYEDKEIHFIKPKSMIINNFSEISEDNFYDILFDSSPLLGDLIKEAIEKER